MVQPRHPQCCHGSDTSHCTGHFRPCRWHRKSIRHLHLKVMIQGIPGTGTRYCLWLKFVETMNHEEGNWLMFSISGESCFLEWQHDFSNLSKKKAIEPCEHRMFIVTENITLLSSRWCQIYLDLPSGQNLCQLFTRKKTTKRQKSYIFGRSSFSASWLSSSSIFGTFRTHPPVAPCSFFCGPAPMGPGR